MHLEKVVVSASVMIVCACIHTCFTCMCCEQHLVKDQRVLKLVQRLAALEEEGETRSRRQVADDWDELTAYVSLHIYICTYMYMYVFTCTQ